MFSIQIFCLNLYALILHNPKYLLYRVSGFIISSLSVAGQLPGQLTLIEVQEKAFLFTYQAYLCKVKVKHNCRFLGLISLLLLYLTLFSQTRIYSGSSY
jgi:hypothetical protein